MLTVLFFLQNLVLTVLYLLHNLVITVLYVPGRRHEALGGVVDRCRHPRPGVCPEHTRIFPVNIKNVASWTAADIRVLVRPLREDNLRGNILQGFKKAKA